MRSNQGSYVITIGIALILVSLLPPTGILAESSVGEASSDWTTFQCNMLRTGYNDHDRINLVIGKHWTVQVSEHCLDQLTVVGYRIYAVDRTDAGGPL
ncbi:hypothetical protein KQH82_10560 [bacterium]|nr:hypothetical protein [bacterium]